jgi:hypothetical protein
MGILCKAKILLVLFPRRRHIGTGLIIFREIYYGFYGLGKNGQEMEGVLARILERWNRVYTHYNHLLDETAKAWNHLTEEQLQSICNVTWIRHEI